jgi:hypothetical protein
MTVQKISALIVSITTDAFTNEALLRCHSSKLMPLKASL